MLYHIKWYHVTLQYLILCHIIQYGIVSYYVTSYHIISYCVISYYIISHHIISHHIISYHIILCHIILHHIILCHITSYHIILCHIMLYHIISYHIISYLIISDHIIFHGRLVHHIVSYRIVSYRIKPHFSSLCNVMLKNLRLSHICWKKLNFLHSFIPSFPFSLYTYLCVSIILSLFISSSFSALPLPYAILINLLEFGIGIYNNELDNGVSDETEKGLDTDAVLSYDQLRNCCSFMWVNNAISYYIFFLYLVI